LRDEIVDLGTRYGIVTAYTSYLALEPNAAVQNVVASPNVGLTGAATRAKIDGRPPKSMRAEDVHVTTGQAGVQQSKLAREQQEAARVEKDSMSSAMKTVRGKTFYLRGGVWSDVEFKPDAHLPETTVRFGSDDYFSLLKQKPHLAEFLSLGERIIVVFEGRVYRVTAGS
jgi:Ca-activated chloride channel family protein